MRLHLAHHELSTDPLPMRLGGLGSERVRHISSMPKPRLLGTTKVRGAGQKLLMTSLSPPIRNNAHLEPQVMVDLGSSAAGLHLDIAFSFKGEGEKDREKDKEKERD